MQRNRVQFQKGLSLGAFLQRYGSEPQCAEAIFKARWPRGYRCRACGSRSHCRLRTRKLFQCNTCKHQVSLTAGTLFASTRLPLTTWFLAIHLLTQSKHGISSLELARQLGVSQNTAWQLKHKLMQAMRERDERVPLAGIVQVDDAYWGGQRHGQRGRGAAGKTPFVAAVEVTADGRPHKLRMSCVKGFRKAVLRSWAARHLRPGTRVHSDGLACFRGVAEAGCEHLATVTGGGPASCEQPRLRWVNTMLGNVKRSIDGTYHAIDAKHVPRYLGAFSYRFNRRYQLADLVPRLVYASANTPPMPGRLLKLDEPYV